MDNHNIVMEIEEERKISAASKKLRVDEGLQSYIFSLFLSSPTTDHAVESVFKLGYALGSKNIK